MISGAVVPQVAVLSVDDGVLEVAAGGLEEIFRSTSLSVANTGPTFASVADNGIAPIGAGVTDDINS